MTRILIVDDEAENIEALKTTLQDENSGWEFFVAGSVREALAVIEKQLVNASPIDVVVTDLVMETDQCGMKILSEARRMDPRVVTILVTAKEAKLDRVSAFETGAFDVIEKNILGKSAAHEINVKTRFAVQFRQSIERVGFLQRYFDPQLFSAIEADQSVLDMKTRTLTICFWDIRGFSLLCEILKAHPNLIAGFLEEYCSAGAQCLFQHAGVLDKFIGDGVMALFGVMQDNTDDGQVDAINAINAAFEFRQEFEKLVSRWREVWYRKGKIAQRIDIGLGCGIHTADVLAGKVGTKSRDQFTALGPDVNLAARIEARASAGQILLSQSTQSRVNKSIRTCQVGTISDIKNIPGTFDLFEAHPLS